MSGQYNPYTLELDPGETPYQQAHEFAHVRQHVRQTYLWRLWMDTRTAPVFGYWTRCLVEIEATALALAELHRLGALEWSDVREACGCLWSYARGLFRT